MYSKFHKGLSLDGFRGTNLVDFPDYHLIEVRKNLHSLLEVAIVSSNDLYAESNERDTVVCFCERVEKLVEAGLNSK